MKIDRLEDGSGMVLINGNGEFLNVSFMEFWEICKAGDRMNTKSEVEEYLSGCEEIGGYDADNVLDNSKLIDNIVEEVISQRINNENGDQIWEAAEKKIKEFYEQKVTLTVHDYLGEFEDEPVRSIEFTVSCSDLENLLDSTNDSRTVDEFFENYFNDEAKKIYDYMKVFGKLVSEKTIYCEQFEKQYNDFMHSFSSKYPSQVSSIAKEQYYKDVFLKRNLLKSEKASLVEKMEEAKGKVDKKVGKDISRTEKEMDF